MKSTTEYRREIQAYTRKYEQGKTVFFPLITYQEKHSWLETFLTDLIEAAFTNELLLEKQK